MKANGGSMDTAPFIPSALDSGESSASQPSCFTPGLYWTENWIGPMASLDDLETSNISCPYRELNPASSSPQSSYGAFSQEIPQWPLPLCLLHLAAVDYGQTSPFIFTRQRCHHTHLISTASLTAHNRTPGSQWTCFMTCHSLTGTMSYGYSTI